MSDNHYDRMHKARTEIRPRKGLDVVMLDVGDVVTFSRNLITGDRSYISSVWRILATNRVQIAVEWVAGDKPYRVSLLIVLADEHEFYDGRPFLSLGEVSA